MRRKSSTDATYSRRRLSGSRSIRLKRRTERRAPPRGTRNRYLRSAPGDGVRRGVDLVELELACEHALLPFLVHVIAFVELGHDFAREQLERRADVLVQVLARLVQQDHLVDIRRLELP